jgi:uncharacterized protein
VILVDVNILVYASLRPFPEHTRAREWLDRRLGGVDRLGLPWATLLGFLRVATNRRVVEQPLPIADAWDQVKLWRSADCVWIPQPTDRHGDVLGRMLALPGIKGDLVPDAHLAALAIEHGLTLCSTDGDFSRFPGLRWENPLKS